MKKSLSNPNLPGAIKFQTPIRRNSSTNALPMLASDISLVDAVVLSNTTLEQAVTCSVQSMPTLLREKLNEDIIACLMCPPSTPTNEPYIANKPVEIEHAVLEEKMQRLRAYRNRKKKLDAR